MTLANELRRRTRQAIVPVVAICVTGYFGYHLVQGDYGLVSWLRLSHEIEETKAQLAQVSEQREALERRVSLLRPESLDRDMIEERARVTLGFAHENDVVILNPQ
ncbi:septum formation initiator family protein [Oleomonas cavernae]|uniref:Septum formation initiator family protein n=1 Tax=Oleomonas cavernae TaxID=2320859 RepID=A0A418WBK5_9PROT|nr:septum formation initiator family protein [Oleomonas cavernae]RJF87411.1 septum formation initiator family protein [Oleomonas cavernae]